MLKLAVLSFLFMYAYAAYYEDIAAQTILEQNADPQAQWKAGYNSYFRGRTEEQLKRLMGAKKMDKKKRAQHPVKSDVLATIPTAFHAGVDKWTQCANVISYIKDQADCGSCWAVAASEVVEDRVCIANVPSSTTNELLNETPTPIAFAAEDIMSCCSYCGQGCGGGYPIDAMKYWMMTGVATGGWYGSNCGCLPYQIPPCPPSGCSAPEAKTPKCATACRTGYSIPSVAGDKHKASSYYQVQGNVQAIQTEIMTNGPVECAFDVYANFMSYKSGIYTQHTGQLLGGHAVKIVGWGQQAGTNYWIINNSWNVTWGMQGVFWFEMGKDLCGMESQCVGGMAKTSDTNFNLQC